MRHYYMEKRMSTLKKIRPNTVKRLCLIVKLELLKRTHLKTSLSKKTNWMSNLLHLLILLTMSKTHPVCLTLTLTSLITTNKKLTTYRTVLNSMAQQMWLTSQQRVLLPSSLMQPHSMNSTRPMTIRSSSLKIRRIPTTLPSASPHKPHSTTLSEASPVLTLRVQSRQ
uniref:Uncharacterized protein n=1 Tax=Cacopsylla melanoneura TaxID=428564 RepID=A0A8D8ZWH7_9HEMI